LAGHVFACQDGDHVVLLDLKADRYFALAVAPTEEAVPLHGWPVAGGADARLVQMLIGRGWVTTGEGQARRGDSSLVSRAAREVFCDRYEEDLRRPSATVLAFIAATGVATVAIRCWRLERVVHRVAQRNAAHGGAVPADIERLRQLIAVFADLRPYLFGWRDACLFESFVLSEFLARHGIFPSWVFGVQARPFGAHCWLQLDDIVLNDTVERVSAYMPIMAV